MKICVQVGWNDWGKVSGVMCGNRVSATRRGHVFRMVVRPAVLYGLETVIQRKRREAELGTAKTKLKC